ncbi:MAG: hypothetical protein IJK63_04075 [Oscillospiraceae bacterium]|nr:hypothetical protein [Oscillospiraceae bacterium]
MKKIFAILLLVCMVLSLAACGGAKTAEYKLGMGVSLNMNSSKAGNAQVDATCAVVVLDKDGKIVACRIDVAQNKMDVTDGQVDTGKTFLTKVELGDDYNMVKYSDATHEWYEQAAAFEQYCIGKTADEIANMETVVNEEGHTVTTDETLYASCSISIGDFQDAVVKACNDDQAATFTSDGTFTLGLAINSTAAESTAATAEEEGVVKMYSEFGAVVLDKDGKILAALTDATQPQIKIDAAGEIGDKTFKGTKRELKEGYNMVAYSDATLEWYQQAKNFTDYCVGKTAADLRATETKEDGGHTVFADETLYASCSISVQGMIDVVAKACDNAK